MCAVASCFQSAFEVLEYNSKPRARTLVEGSAERGETVRGQGGAVSGVARTEDGR
jgi:hypothetical protein